MSEPQNQGGPQEGSPLPLAIPGPSQMTPELIAQMFDNQTQELDIRREELQLRREEAQSKEREDMRGYDFAVKSLDAQVEDRREMRISSKGFMDRILSFLLTSLVILAVGCGYALYLGKDQLVLELAKLTFTFLGGGAAGWGLRNSKKIKTGESEE